MSEIGAFIKRSRQKNKLSLNKLAALTDMKNSQLSRIENNKQSVSPLDLKKLAGILGVDQIEIMIIAGYIDRSAVSAKLRLQRVDNLNDDQIRIAQLFIDFLIENNKEVLHEI